MKRRMNKGFTLIEFSLYAVIVSLMMASLVVVGSNIMRARLNIFISETIEHQGRVATNIITQQIRQAKEVTVPPDYSSLELVNSEDEAVVFFIEEDFLVMSVGGSETELISQEVVVNNLTFERDENSVKIVMEIAYSNPLERTEHQIKRVFQTTENLWVSGSD